jgi:hypothetical protein
METVACITTYFNPVGYRNRRENYAAFAEALEADGVPLLTVELAFGDDAYDLPECPNTLRLRGRSRLWMKERMINAAVSRLPAQYTAFAWLDCDLIFADRSWFRRLNEALEAHDIVQLFERVVHLPPGHRRYRGEDEGSDTGLAAQAARLPDWLPRRLAGKLPFAVPGYAWAARRSLFGDAGLYDRSILGSGDAIVADALFNSDGLYSYAEVATSAMTDDIACWRRQIGAGARPRVGYLPLNVYHMWHGTFEDRRYSSKDEILLRYDFDPRRDLVLQGDLYEWGSDKPGLHTEVAAYFSARREDGV